ncbi:prepilin peptidase [Devosia sp. ZB163]|uniref:A24 family peptidase n=1 Tax=Devosia sp. ZB163 TaxID=3025938 RepID=UPI00236245D8|nr:prepilin peptidase [Devosia sp. ZB163]MDC9823224.1 prepilin peptidase [Devosia sp. ZB163]
MPSFIPIAALFIFPMLMAFAGASDLLTMRITNKLVLLVAIGFFPVALVAGLPLETIGVHVATALVVLAVTIGFFALGWIGGGDAKLIAATTLWFGLTGLLPYLLYASLLGGALTLVLLAVRSRPLPLLLKQVTWIDRLHDTKTGVPYGIALAAAAILLYPGSIVFQRLVG